MSNAAASPMRVCQVWCPDWPVVARRWLYPELRDVPVAVVGRVDGREVVVSASVDARADDVTTGLRRRDAEARCPELVVIDADPVVDASAFEAVARAVESLTPRLELVEPGRLAFPTRGPSRYHGGDDGLAAQVIAVVRAAGVTDVRVGIADGAFAARVATRSALPDDAHIVVAGDTAAFLAPWPVAALGVPALTDLLHRLGLTSLGAFAALPADTVLARFGDVGAHAHRLARGIDSTLGRLGVVPPDLVETHEFDPPVSRVDTAAFAAKALADRLLDRLAANGLACTRVAIEAATDHGDVFARTWRASEPFTPGALAERVRWQLDAWLLAGHGRARDADLADAGVVTGGLTVLRVVPDEVVVAHGRQLGFWGGDAAAAERAARVLARVQGMLGPDAVVTAVMQGGRLPDERVRWVRAGDPREPETLRTLARRAPDRTGAPWPGGVPGPAPARVIDAVAVLVGADGQRLAVDGRGEANGKPARVQCDALPGGGGDVIAWAGPWPHDVRWWDNRTRRRGATWHLVVAAQGSEIACVVVVSRGRARVVAIHD